MNQEAVELHSRYVHLRAKDAELRVKLEQMRDILAKADDRRTREPGSRSRWNPIIDNLELSYKHLKQEVERSRYAVQQTERELARALDATGESLESIHNLPFEPVHLSDLDADVDDVEYSGDRALGWRDLLHMSIDNLATLTEEELADIRRCMEGPRPHQMNETDRRLVEGRLQLAAQLRASAEEDDAAPGMVDRRRQIILRAAIDKIQHNRAQMMTNEEMRAIVVCQQRLIANANPSIAEKRLLRIVEAAISVLRRHRAKT